ncbi:hypothetical protein [Azospirillum thermophilum]|uniref:hypothetical protein n=1 Tax=Azospirillum thermophilum TaxID=2202148 RepID=UPI001FEB64CD|nr:hypothetical protein [Azospirillum thermophilum]
MPAQTRTDARTDTRTGGRPDEGATVVQVLEAFRTLDPDLPIQYALSFMTIAQSEGISIGSWRNAWASPSPPRRATSRP